MNGFSTQSLNFGKGSFDHGTLLGSSSRVLILFRGRHSAWQLFQRVSGQSVPGPGD